MPSALALEDIRSNFSRPGSYSLFHVYSQSKLANVMFTRELARRLDETRDGSSPLLPQVEAEQKAPGLGRVTVNTLHPGNVVTEVTRNLPSLVRYAPCPPVNVNFFAYYAIY